MPKKSKRLQRLVPDTPISTDDFVLASLRAVRDDEFLTLVPLTTHDDVLDPLLDDHRFAVSFANKERFSALDNFEPDNDPQLVVEPLGDILPAPEDILPVTIDDELPLNPSHPFVAEPFTDSTTVPSESNQKDAIHPELNADRVVDTFNQSPLNESAALNSIVNKATISRTTEEIVQSTELPYCAYKTHTARLNVIALIVSIVALLAAIALYFMLQEIRHDIVKLNEIVEIMKEDSQIGRDNAAAD